MNLFSTPEFKVGALVIAVSGLIAAMSLRVAQGPGFLGGSKRYSFVVDDAGGVIKNSAVKLAGIKVGIIHDIQLEDNKARIFIDVDNRVRITTSTRATLKSDGILGDRHVELAPGNSADPALPDGSNIAVIEGKQGLDQVMGEVGKITKSLNSLAETLSKATVGKGDDTSPVGRIVLNIEKVSRDLSEMTGSNKEKIGEMLSRIESLTRNLDKFINEESLGHVQAAARNIDDITAKINKGEGTVGKLINDEHTIEEINSAISNINSFLEPVAKMEASVDFHSEFLTQSALTKSYLGIKLQPGLDRYYELQIVSDPRGVKTQSYHTEVNNGGPIQTSDRTDTYINQIKISALFAKNFYDFTLKGGIIENTGGIGADYHLLDRKLKFSMEFFNFSHANLRIFARYNFFKGIYATGGVDNVLNTDNQFSTFIGAGLFITNDDLKVLASRLPL